MGRGKAFLIKLVSTAGFVGYLPLMPGTFGSAAGLLVYACVFRHPLAYLAALAAVIALGVAVCGPAEKLFGRHDPGVVVIDEVAGMLIAAAAIPFSFRNIALAFFLFRLFDTVKPFPAGRLQYLRGSKGIMADDLVAGVYANLVLQLGLRLAVMTGS